VANHKSEKLFELNIGWLIVIRMYLMYRMIYNPFAYLFVNFCILYTKC